MNLNRYFGLTVMVALLITLSACSSKTAETEAAAKEKATEQHAGEAKEEHGKEEAAGEHAEVGGESGEEENAKPISMDSKAMAAAGIRRSTSPSGCVFKSDLNPAFASIAICSVVGNSPTAMASDSATALGR